MKPRRRTGAIPELPPMVAVDAMSREELELAVLSLRESLISERILALRAREQRDEAVAELRDGAEAVSAARRVQRGFPYKFARFVCLPFELWGVVKRRLKADR